MMGCLLMLKLSSQSSSCMITGMRGGSVSVRNMSSLPAFRFLDREDCHYTDTPRYRQCSHLCSTQAMRTASSSMPTMMRAGTTKAMMYSCGGSRS